MPKVPVAVRRIPDEIGAAPRVSSSAGAGSFGGFEAEALQTIGAGVTRLGEQAVRQEAADALVQSKFKERKDKLWADEQTIELNDSIRQFRADYLTDPSTDGLSTRLRDKIEKKRNEILNRTTDDQQKQFFMSNYNPKALVALNAGATYEVEEFKKREANTLVAINENTVRAAAEAAPFFGTPEGNLALADSRNDLEDVMTRQTEGMSPSQTKNFKAEGRSTYHLSVLNSLVSASATGAQEYYKNNKKEILPENRQAVEDVLKTEDTLQSAQIATDEIMATENDPAERSKLARTFKYLGTDEEKAKKRAKTEEMVGKRNDALKQDEVDKTKETLTNALIKINDSNNQVDGDAIADRLVDPESAEKARAYSERKFKRKKEDIVTKREVLGSVLDRINTGEFETATELLEFSPDLSDTDYKWLVGKLESYKTGQRTGKKADGEVISYANAKAAFQNVFKIQTYNAEEQGASFSAMLKLLESQGKDLSVGEAEAVIRKDIVDNRGEVGEAVESFGYDDKITYEEALRTNQIDVYLPKISVNDDNKERIAIRSAYINNGYRDNIPEIMLRLYKKKYIDNLPMSTDEMAQFNDGLSTLERREK